MADAKKGLKAYSGVTKKVEQKKPATTTVADVVAAKKEEVKKVSAPVETVKAAPVEKKAPAKAEKAVKKAPVKAAEKVEKTEKAPAKTAAKKTTAKKAELKSDVVLQWYGNNVNVDKVVDAAKKAYVAEGHRESSIKSIEVYLKPEDGAAYYVINGVAGKVDLF